MVCYGVLWCAMVCYGVLWCVMVCYGVLWCVMVYNPLFDAPWLYVSILVQFGQTHRLASVSVIPCIHYVRHSP